STLGVALPLPVIGGLPMVSLHAGVIYRIDPSHVGARAEIVTSWAIDDFMSTGLVLQSDWYPSADKHPTFALGLRLGL
ncbi:MAG: hypothetical protein JRH20_25740, partial [Deltaproteobacteria bacterium]|nr:hypothetical protein [Deltaproteobacteria bacterium]